MIHRFEIREGLRAVIDYYAAKAERVVACVAQIFEPHPRHAAHRPQRYQDDVPPSA